MTVRRDLQREFADAYMRSSGHALVTATRSAHAFAHSIQTIIVDTPHLTDGAQELAEIWTLPATTATTLATAYHATTMSTRALMRGLHHVSGESTTIATQPAETGSNDVEWAAWHHGEELELTVTGSVPAVLNYCDVTENEREVIILAARRLSAGNHIVFACARGLSKDTQLRAGALNFDGLISCLLHTYPGIPECIVQLRRAGKRVVYMTSEPEDIATYIGHACAIVDQPSPARHAGFTTSPAHAIYAHVNRRSAHRLLATLPQPVLIARHRLDVVARMLASFH